MAKLFYAKNKTWYDIDTKEPHEKGEVKDGGFFGAAEVVLRSGKEPVGEWIEEEVNAYKDFVENEGWLKSKESGKMRLEGKDYIVNDGDILNFRFNT